MRRMSATSSMENAFDRLLFGRIPVSMRSGLMTSGCSPPSADWSLFIRDSPSPSRSEALVSVIIEDSTGVSSSWNVKKSTSSGLSIVRFSNVRLWSRTSSTIAFWLWVNFSSWIVGSAEAARMVNEACGLAFRVDRAIREPKVLARTMLSISAMARLSLRSSTRSVTDWLFVVSSTGSVMATNGPLSMLIVKLASVVNVPLSGAASVATRKACPIVTPDSYPSCDTVWLSLGDAATCSDCMLLEAVGPRTSVSPVLDATTVSARPAASKAALRSVTRSLIAELSVVLPTCTTVPSRSPFRNTSNVGSAPSSIGRT